jgi:Flp pilus assembly protein TadB
MATASGLRIGDADREAAAAALREHFAEGRLTLDEFQHRLGTVFAAKTDRDLADVTADLPHAAGPPPMPAAPGQASAGNRGERRSRPGLAALPGLVMIILALIVVAVVLPVALFGMAVSRSLLFLLAVLLFGRRGLLRRFRRWLPASRRRWPF